MTLNQRDVIAGLATAAGLAALPRGALAQSLVRMKSFPASGTSGQMGVAIAQMAQRYRYYREAGFDIPEALIPPEAN